MRILIVDDSKTALYVLEKTLTEAGYEIIKAFNGQEAWEILCENDIRLIITDWEMPQMNGVELCQKIRNELLEYYSYIILVTSHEEKWDFLRGLKGGADEVMLKPFDPEELILRVRHGERILAQEIQNVVIFALAKLGEIRNPNLGYHLERVRKYSKIIAMTLREVDKYKEIITSEYCRNIYLASALHDIGKFNIPDSILLKPSKLDYEEQLFMRTHSARGAETIQSIIEQYPGVKFLELARDIAISHHEKYDGLGYPFGIKGEEIPLAGRIVALADVFDSVTHKQIYRDALTDDEARSYIVENSGKRFDPDIVDAFVANEKFFFEIKKELKDAG